MAATTTEQQLQEQQVLQTEVEHLRKDLQRKDADLRLATSALLAIHNGTKLQDLVEMNLALDEQVKSLKKMVQMMQSQCTSDRASTVPIATEADIQRLLSKLSTKEMQLDVLRKRSAGWEQQVIDLKFELQSLKDAAKEKEAREKQTHEALVRREQAEQPKDAPATTENEVQSPMTSPRAPDPDLVYLKRLAFVRGKYWLRAEERANALKEALAAEKTKCEALQREAARVEQVKRSLDASVAQVQTLEAQLRETERELAEKDSELQHTHLLHEEERTQFKIERRRSCRIMQELRGELNLQLMQLEKLYNLPKPPSPRKVALPPSKALRRRPSLQRSASSSKADGRRNKSSVKFQAAA